MEHIHRPKLATHHHGAEKAHSHTIGHKASDRNKLLLTIIITGSMMVVEFVAGVVVNSLALVNDAGHMLTYFFALAVSYVAILIAGRPATVRFQRLPDHLLGVGGNKMETGGAGYPSPLSCVRDSKFPSEIFQLSQPPLWQNVLSQQ